MFVLKYINFPVVLASYNALSTIIPMTPMWGYFRGTVKLRVLFILKSSCGIYFQLKEIYLQWLWINQLEAEPQGQAWAKEICSEKKILVG